MNLGMSALVFMAVETTGQPGCTHDVTLLSPVQPMDGAAGNPTSDAASVDDTRAPDQQQKVDALPTEATATAGSACTGQGPAITLLASGTSVCAAALATRAYRFALCACETLGVIQPLKTDVFDSVSGAVGGAASAAIGVNRYIQATAEMHVAGALYVAGAGGLTTTMPLETAASLRVAGPSAVASAQVGTDAFFGGDISGTYNVAGALHVSPTSTLLQGVIATSSIAVETISIPTPCNCDPTVVDIPGSIAASAAHNDNQTIGLSFDRLNPVDASTVLDIPCGHYVLSAIDASRTVFLAVHGRASLAVTGDVVLHAGLTVMLDPGAELDLMVGGNLQSDGGNSIGAVAPARFRIWVAGSELVVFDGAPSIGAMIYAPASIVTGDGAVDLSGGLVARTALFGNMNIHFDQAIFSAGVPCGEPTATAVP